MSIGPLESLLRIDGKIALVTDSGGCGSLDVAPLLARAGAQVIIADRDAAAAQALAREAGPDACAIPTDIESEPAILALFTAIKSRFGQLDILVNCAGLTANAPLTETTMAQYDEMQSVNLRATFMLMREAVGMMRDQGTGGRIVNISTIGTLHPVLNGNAAYAATRTGVTGMTKAVALDHAKDGIRANLVLPGAVHGKTRFHASTAARLTGGSSLTGPITEPGRLPFGYGNGQDIAAAVLYLCGPSGAYITGQSIVLDGGFLLT
jgi:NAD(P)-dependent dehydrogenase (short-subunit alcohol dehydrogenase family)